MNDEDIQLNKNSDKCFTPSVAKYLCIEYASSNKIYLGNSTKVKIKKVLV